MMKKILIVFCVSLILPAALLSQESKKIGLGGSLQQGQVGIMVPAWISKKIAIVPTISFKFAEKIGTDIGIGIAPRLYLRKSTVSPYFGLNLGTLINIPSKENELGDETMIDFLGGLAFGGEYFIGDNFSLGVEAQGNFTKSHKDSFRFGNPDGLNFNTGTMIYATVYF